MKSSGGNPNCDSSGGRADCPAVGEQSSMSHSTSEPVVVGQGPLGIEALIQVAVHGAKVRLCEDPAWRKQMAACEALVAKAVADGTPIYGVTTGFGSNCGARISAQSMLALGEGLLRFHGCGTGPALPVATVRGAMLCRILCLGLGYSGVRVALLERLVEFLNRHITPVVPAQGSVGASGDLTPMSYVAATLAGQREVFFQGQRMPAARALELSGLAPFVFAVKEPISMLNGTPIMTGVAIVVADQCRRILAAATRATAHPRSDGFHSPEGCSVNSWRIRCRSIAIGSQD